MSETGTESRPLPRSIGAGLVVQLLSALASFLAAFVLPYSLPGVPSEGRIALFGLGILFLVLAVLSAVIGQKLSAFTQRFGLGPRVLVPREGLICLGIMLIIAVAALTGGNPDTGNMLLLVFGLMSGGFVLNGWVVVGMLARISVSRTLPNSAAAGSFFTVEVSLRNDKRRLSSRLIEVRDLVQGADVRAEPRVVFVRVGPQGVRSAAYQIALPHRGLYRFGPLRVSSRFPLGIGERGQSVEQPAELFVYPALGKLRPEWRHRARRLEESESSAAPKQGVFDDEFHGIREYRPGDNRRAVHWRSSARHAALMVREHQQHRQSDAILLLDLCTAAEASLADLENAISFAATVCVEQAQRSTAGRHRLLIAGQILQQVDVQGAAAFREAALHALATCTPAPKPRIDELLQAASQSPASPGQQLLLITPRPREARAIADAFTAQHHRSDPLAALHLEFIPCQGQQLAAWFITPHALQPPAAQPSGFPRPAETRP
ncbi:MAG: hypothetical protein RL215_759 [Planctomycetota bacterium]|jgi:uncharacterized protein (DUF58 family)